MTKNDKIELSLKQKTALPFFLGNQTIDEACKEAGVSRNCYYEWLKEPVFKSALDRLREEIVLDAIGKLKLSTTKAAMTLCNLMDREDCPSVQRAAANDILNQVVKFKEIHELEKRLDEVERLINRQEGAV